MMLTPLLYHLFVLFFSFTRPYILDTLDYSLTQEKRREDKSIRIERSRLHQKGNKKDITTQNENESSLVTIIISHKGHIIQA